MGKGRGVGATDMEARDAGGADAFLGFGGVAVRDKVKAGADWSRCVGLPI